MTKIPKVCERAAEKIMMSDPPINVEECIYEFASIIAEETHLAEVVEFLRQLRACDSCGVSYKGARVRATMLLAKLI